MGFPEVHPDPDSTRWVDLQLTVLLDVLELARAGIVENEYHRRQSARQVDLTVQKLRNGYRPVALVVDELKVAGKMTALASVPSISAVDEVILDDRNPAELVWNPCRVLSRSDGSGCWCSGATRRRRCITNCRGVASAGGGGVSSAVTFRRAGVGTEREQDCD